MGGTNSVPLKLANNNINYIVGPSVFRGVLLYTLVERGGEDKVEKEFKKVIGDIRLYGKLKSSDESVGFSFSIGNSDEVFDDDEEDKELIEAKQIENKE